MLSRFLSDPAKQEGRFPLRKDRRQHLHQQIEKHHLDLTHVTFRAGSPQTLVCTKTLASYERRQKQYEVDKKLLAELEALAADEKKPPSNPHHAGDRLRSSLYAESLMATARIATPPPFEVVLRTVCRYGRPIDPKPVITSLSNHYHPGPVLRPPH